MIRQGQGVRTVKEDAEHLVEQTTQDESKDGDPAHDVDRLTELDLVIGNRLGQGTPQQIWEALKDPRYLKIIFTITAWVANRYPVPVGYVLEELRQDVLLLFISWLSRQVRKSGLKPVLVKPGPMLIAMTRNLLVSKHRHDTAQKRDYRSEVSIDDVVGLKCDAPSAGDIERNLILSAALERLSGRDRHVFIRRALYGMTYEEIGAEVGVSRQAVRERCKRIVAELRRALGADGE